MKNLNNIAKDLFDKLRSRFPSIQIGDDEGLVTNVPEDARYYDFTYTDGKQKLGKIAVYIDEKDGLSILFNRDIVANQPNSVKREWYSFLRQMRTFAKKRMMNFDVRDIEKTNLTQRDYKHLANRNKKIKDNVQESRLRGNYKKSYENIGEARLVINHSRDIDPDVRGSRSRNISSIYIENQSGERFRYPHRHLNGARAMAQHVAHGGNPYDDFGKYITDLSEEMWKLRKFKNYTNRSAVMAEGLRDYVQIIQERIVAINKKIKDLQKSNYYEQEIQSYTKPVLEEIPRDVRDNWIDQLTVKQFNEELADIFPYVYRLISQKTPQEINIEGIDEDYVDI